MYPTATEVGHLIRPTDREKPNHPKLNRVRYAKLERDYVRNGYLASQRLVFDPFPFLDHSRGASHLRKETI